MEEDKGHQQRNIGMNGGNYNERIEGNYYQITIHNYYREIVSTHQDTDLTSSEDNLLCPYQGLFHFSHQEAEYFFGRDEFIEELFQVTQTRNFIPVLGASGSGKSSVVLAGLVPRLVQQGNWQFTHFRPGGDPFHALALALVPLYRSQQDSTDNIIQARKLATSLSQNELPLGDVFEEIKRHHPKQRILVIADQFEELYTLCRDEQIRRRFLDTLLDTFKPGSQQSELSQILVATMRVDFLGNALSYRPLANVLRDKDVKISSMDSKELREVIVKPAQKLGVSFDSGLVERILKDIDKEPGNLPLLEFALTELWQKRDGKQLTHQGYEAIGEVSGALTSYADGEFKKFKPEEQEKVKRIFVQLVRPGEGTEDTRRVATKAELHGKNWDLVRRLADARLVVTSRAVITHGQNAEQETVEIVHEALIRNWGQLKGWMATDREFRAWQERIRAAMVQWQEMNRDGSLLLRGAALVQAQEKLSERREELSGAEREFIGLSQKSQKRQHQRTIGLITAAFVVISGIAGVADWQRRRAVRNETMANLRAKIATLDARLVSGEASLQLQLEAIKVGRELQKLPKPSLDVSIQGRDLLRRIVYETKKEVNHLSGHQDLVIDVVFSPDGKYLASASEDDTVKLWTAQGDLVTTMSDHEKNVIDVVFSPDGQFLASASWDKTVKLWTAQGKLVANLEGHQNIVRKVVFSPDGKYLASASDDKTVKLWTAQGKLVANLEGHQNIVRKVVFSPDGKYLASASDDKTVKLWTAQGKLVANLEGHQNIVRKVVFSPDGKYLASASDDKTVKLWTAQGKLVANLEGHQGWVTNLVFSPDGKYLVSASDDETVKLWTAQGKLVSTLSGYQSNIHEVVFSPDGKYLASAGGTVDKTVKLWNLEKELVTTLFGHQGSVNGVMFSPDGKYLASVSGDKTVKLWTAKVELVSTLFGHQGSVDVVFSPDGKYLASANLDKTVKLWNLEGELVTTLSGHQEGVTDVVFSPDGKYFASASFDKTVKLWTAQGELVANLEGHQDTVWKVVFSPDGKYLASASFDKTVKLWTAQGELVANLEGHQGYVDKVVFSSDSQYLASASYDKTMKLWNLEGELITTLSGRQGGVIDEMVFSPDGKYLASAGSDNTVKLWNLEGELIATLSGHQDNVSDVVFSPDGKYLASASSDNTVKLWNLEGELIATLSGHQDNVSDVVFSPDGKYLASASSDNTVKLWNLEGELVTTLSGHQKSITDVKFSPDGQYLASASYDKTVKLWNFNLEELLTHACNHVGNYLINNPDVKEEELALCKEVLKSLR